MNSLQSLVSCAITNGLTLSAINGNIGEWVKTCRNADGERPTTEEFKAEYERQMTVKSQQPDNAGEIPEGK